MWENDFSQKVCALPVFHFMASVRLSTLATPATPDWSCRRNKSRSSSSKSCNGSTSYIGSPILHWDDAILRSSSVRSYFADVRTQFLGVSMQQALEPKAPHDCSEEALDLERENQYLRMLLGMVKQKHQDRCGNETLDHARKEWAATTAQRAVHARRVHEEELAHAVQSARKIAEDDAMARAATYHSVLISSAITAAVADLKQHLLEEHSQAMQETASKAVHMVASSAESILDPRREHLAKRRATFDLVLDKAESALSPR